MQSGNDARRARGTRWIAAAAAFALALSGAANAQDATGGKAPEAAPTSQPTTAPAEAKAEVKKPVQAQRTLEEARLAMGKWIETQQIISKEKKDWQQAREILVGRLDLVKQEAASHEQKIKDAKAEVAETEKKKSELAAENDALKAVGAGLSEKIAAMEAEIKKLMKRLPDPLKTKLQPLFQRIPEDPKTAKVAIAERFQNVLGILNEVTKAQNEITVNVEVRTLDGGKVSEVKAMYIGLAQAFYVSAGGEAGIGRPTDDGWKWEPSKAVAKDVITAIEILEGKHSPAYVPLPVKIQ